MPIEEKGRLRYIEPTEIDNNGTDGYVSPLEDYYIYVDLEIARNDRYACGLAKEQGREETRTFRAVGNGKSFFKGTDGNLTTSFTEINPINPDKNTDESLGVKSIKIDYTSWQCPQATIVFTDVKGASLMGKNEAYANGTAKQPSFFNEMFMMPYPIFRLTIKGFYGNAVTYNLSLKDTSLSLDASTGNFDVTANFVGYMYGPLADIPMSLLVVAPYVYYDGRNLWDEMKGTRFCYLNDDGGKVPMLRFPELRLKLAQLATNEDYIKPQKEKEARINELNKRKTALEEIINNNPFKDWVEYEGKTFMFVAKTTKTENWYDEKAEIEGSIGSIFDKLGAYDKRYGTNWCNEYSFLKEKKAFNGWRRWRQETKLNNNQYGEINERGFVSLKESYQYIDDKSASEYLDLIENDPKLQSYRLYVLEKDIEYFIDDFKKLKEELAVIESQIEAVDSEYRNVSNKVAADFLGFPPTIRNFYNMVFAHVETLARLIYGVTQKISDELKNNSENRKPSTYGLSLSNTDINQSLGNPYMPPFTAVYSNKEEQGQTKKELLWIGDLNNHVNLQEVDLVNAIVDAARLYTTREFNTQRMIEAASKDNGVSINGDITEFIPLTYYDFAHFGSIRNPYYEAVDYGRDGSDVTPQILSTFALRAYYYLLGDDGTKANEGNAFGVLEALNLYKAFGNEVNGSFVNFYKKYIDAAGQYAYWEGERYLERGDGDWNFLKIPMFSNCRYVWYKNDGDKVMPVGEFSLRALQSAFNAKPDENPDERFVNITDLDKNKGNFYVFPSGNYVRDIVENVSKINFGEFEDDLEVYREKNVIRNLANNMDGYKGNIWNNTQTYDTSMVMEWKDESFSAMGELPLLEAMRNGGDNVYFRLSSHYGNTGASLFGQPFYYIQNNIKAKAYLFIFSLPYRRNLNNGGIPSKANNGTMALVELLREGAVYWRQEEDLIATEGNADFTFGLQNVNGHFKFKKAGTDEIYFKGQAVYGIPYGENGSYLRFKPVKGGNKERRRVLMEMFVKWAENDFPAIDSLLTDPDVYDINRYSPTVNKSSIRGLVLDYKRGVGGGIDARSRKCERIQFLLRETAFGMRTVIDTLDGIYTVWNEAFGAAFNGFFTELKKIYEGQIKNNETRSNSRTAIEDAFKDKDIRLSTYLTLKNLYDRWFCSVGLDNWVLDVNHNEQNLDEYNELSSFFDKFVYIDSFYHDIGNRLLVNGAKALDILSGSIPSSDDMSGNPTSVYEGMSAYKYLTDLAIACDGQLLSTPMYYGMRNSSSLVDMFRALPLSRTVKKDNSTFVFLYFYQPSKYLDTGHGFRNDGIDLTDELDMLPMSMRDGEIGKGYIIPAFGVTFAKQNQAFFKSISLNTEQPQTSEIGLFATMDIASKSSESPRETTLYGQDIYRIMSSNSYECTVEMMGDAQVLPLMYFQLNGVPLWHGAYMITQVSHNVTPGNMTTTFKGLKLSRNALPMSEGTTITLNSGALETPSNNYLNYSGQEIDNTMDENLLKSNESATVAYNIWNHVFNTLNLGEKGKCAKYVYQMAKAFVGYTNTKFGSGGDSANGNANQVSYWNNLVKLGYTKVLDRAYDDNVRSSGLRTEINKLRVSPGDVLVYFATKPVQSGDSAKIYGHTQFYVGGKVGWTSSIKDNYSNGTSFVYGSKTDLYGWRLLLFKAPKPNSVKA